MRCDEVIRELAVPTDERDQAALSAHLATCSSCAGWATRAAQLDRLWEVTRPAEPSAEIWDAMWSQLAASLDAPAPAELGAFSLHGTPANGSVAARETPVGPARSASRSRRWNWAAIGLIGFAQAAAVLFAINLTWRPSTNSRSLQVATGTGGTAVAASPSVAVAGAGPVIATSALTGVDVEIEEGQVVVIQVEGSMAQVVVRTPQAASYRLDKSLRNLESPLVDDWLLMFNEVESLFKPIVAMQE